MLVIRMQRTGRKGHAMFRVVVQDSRLTPTSGKVVAQLGHYDPHGKTASVDKEKATFYLEHGAQPSERVARLLKAQDVKLPDWVKLPADKERQVRNADKRRSTRPPEPVEETPEPPAEEATQATEAPEAPVEPSQTPAEPETPAEPAETPDADKAETDAAEASKETDDDKPA